ncbi:MAG: enoyl-CoA hydratase/isomerase family protein [bacterium]|nr:enoyl-CoA hydratase/isomerase family protein [bacterium]
MSTTDSATFQHLTIEKKDRLAWLRLNRPPVNDLTPEVIQELTAAHRLLADDDSVWMVILGGHGEKFFCNGLSPEYILAQDAAGREAVFASLFDLMREMYSFPKIEAAAIGGHAMAGGAVLGILCDFRFMAAGKSRFGFSEVAAGLTMPEFLLGIIEGVVGPQHLVEIAMLAKAYRPEEALAIGLVNQVFESGELDAGVENFLNGLMDTLPLQSMQNVKASIRADRNASLEAASVRSLENLRPFLTGNFDEGLTAVLERRKPVFKNT